MSNKKPAFWKAGFCLASAGKRKKEACENELMDPGTDGKNLSNTGVSCIMSTERGNKAKRFFIL